MISGFRNRTEAGRTLAGLLSDYSQRDDLLILALPRGGVPVAVEIARALDSPMDVFVVRRLGVPGHEELAMGAIATGDIRVTNDTVVESLGLTDDDIAVVAQREQRELSRRERLYRGDRPPADVKGRSVIVVDDGLATGSTMRAAIAALRRQRPLSLIVAVPVAARAVCEELRTYVDEIFCAATPESLGGISAWYEDFCQMTDDEVRELLDQASRNV